MLMPVNIFQATGNGMWHKTPSEWCVCVHDLSEGRHTKCDIKIRTSRSSYRTILTSQLVLRLIPRSGSDTCILFSISAIFFWQCRSTRRKASFFGLYPLLPCLISLSPRSPLAACHTKKNVLESLVLRILSLGVWFDRYRLACLSAHARNFF